MIHFLKNIMIIVASCKSRISAPDATGLDARRTRDTKNIAGAAA